MSLHVLNDGHIDGARALSAEAGWNQTADDWRVFLELGRAFGFSDTSGRLVASTALLPYGQRFAWISMVLVTAQWQGHRLAKRLVTHALEYLDDQRLVALLDATPAGGPVYKRLGFSECWGMQRYALSANALSDSAAASMARALADNRGSDNDRAATDHHAAVELRAAVRVMRDADWQQVVAMDERAFGANREALLARLRLRLPGAALVARSDTLHGYCLARDGRVATQIGPVIARDDATAIALVANTLARTEGAVFIDVPDRSAALAAWLLAAGFTSQRPLTRMLRGASMSREAAFDDPELTQAIAGPELG